MTPLRVVCGWCGKHIGTKNGRGVGGVSHGICGACFNEMDPWHIRFWRALSGNALLWVLGFVAAYTVWGVVLGWWMVGCSLERLMR
jgi:phage shock protein PspC (stress-responsive transcriptional regulator)